jgi:hypothetical protein
MLVRVPKVFWNLGGNKTGENFLPMMCNVAVVTFKARYLMRTGLSSRMKT